MGYRRPTVKDLFRDGLRASSGGKRATAPCGHPGEHTFGQFVRCIYGCDGEAVPKPVRPEKTQKICTANHSKDYLGSFRCSTIGYQDPFTKKLIIRCARCDQILETR